MLIRHRHSDCLTICCAYCHLFAFNESIKYFVACFTFVKFAQHRIKAILICCVYNFFFLRLSFLSSHCMQCTHLFHSFQPSMHHLLLTYFFFDSFLQLFFSSFFLYVFPFVCSFYSTNVLQNMFFRFRYRCYCCNRLFGITWAVMYQMYMI